MLKYLRYSIVLAMILGGLAAPAMAQSASELAVRVTQMEDQMRQLVGQVEELTFQVKQLKGLRGESDTGAIDSVPQQEPAKTKQLATQNAPADQGLEQIEDQPLAQASAEQTYMKTIVNEDGSEDQVIAKQAPGPKVLGSLNSSASITDDGGFQGQVLVAPAQQESNADADLSQGDSIETVSLSPDSPEALYERSYESMMRRQYGEAEAGFSTFIEKFSDNSLAGSAQYWLGETYYTQSDFRQAAQAFLRGYKQFPKSRRAADSLLRLGMSLDRMGQKQQACASYDAVSAEYPKAVEARKRAQAEAKRAGCSA
ncbi:MAG: tol-pal system protein YbgF [Rhizobiales bacterium]|nr:tol-pal system protein YbgF [Hyphomicrobiales bacterium]